jgi:hypothetical protein
VVTSGKELFSNSLVSDNYKYKDELITTKTIAPCAIDTTAKCLNDAQSAKTYYEFSVNDSHYEFNINSRRFYAGEVAKGLEKLPANDLIWRVAA